MAKGLHKLTVQEATSAMAQRKVIRVTPTIPIGSPTTFASGDTMTETLVELPNAVITAGGASLLRKMAIFNKDNEDCALQVIFFENNSTSAFGTANAAPSISDANALSNNPIGTVYIGEADQQQFGNFYAGTTGGTTDEHTGSIILQAAAGSTSVYFAIVSRDAATLATTTDITLIFHIDY